ncbi:MAG: DUF2520 domain-containing protein [Syntrophorhabdaceae bacterium]|nr:DUF2520 domain-containing protein [Syntrophorhabdaceae bacterium]
MKIGVIGAGKVGISTSYVMLKSGLDVVVLSDRDSHALDNARQYLGWAKGIILTEDNTEVVEKSDLIIIATQDRVIKSIVRELNLRIDNLDGKYIIHTSGAHSSLILKPLDSKGARLGVIHPLQTFPDIDSAIAVLPETYIFIQGDERCLDVLRFIAEKIGKRAVEIKAEHMVLYHLSAVLVCNLFCALMYAGEGLMREIGISIEPYLPIIRATLKNIEQKGPLRSLTGPIVRGDIDTVISHLKAIEDKDMLKDVYKALSQVALEMTRSRGDVEEETLEKIKDILKRW